MLLILLTNRLYRVTLINLVSKSATNVYEVFCRIALLQPLSLYFFEFWGQIKQKIASKRGNLKILSLFLWSEITIDEVYW